jgi:hypothetical protein
MKSKITVTYKVTPEQIKRWQLALQVACISACTCNTKTPAYTHHHVNCAYRIRQGAIVELDLLKPITEAQTAEPVAWLYCKPTGEVNYDVDHVVCNTGGDTQGDGDYWMPVFAHPAPPAQPVVQQVMDLLACDSDAQQEVLRELSRVHGVTTMQPAQCKQGCPPESICDYCQATGGKDKTEREVLVARLSRKNEDGSLVEITEADQQAAADMLEADGEEIDLWDKKYTAAHDELLGVRAQQVAVPQGVLDAYKSLIEAKSALLGIEAAVGKVVTTWSQIPAEVSPWPSVSLTRESMDDLRKFYDVLPAKLEALDAASKRLIPFVNAAPQPPQGEPVTPACPEQAKNWDTLPPELRRDIEARRGIKAAQPTDWSAA